MTGQQPIRASDRDRESVAEVLRGAYAAGCLDTGELEQRTGEAYRARTLDDLRALTADLPRWLVEGPVPGQYHGRPPRRTAPWWPFGIGLALAGMCLVVVAVAWAPLAAVPLVFVWLMVMVRTRGGPPGSRPPW